MAEYRLLREDETDAAARQHNLGSALIPGAIVHDDEETCAFYRGVFARGPIWGAFDGDLLVGHMALEPGWIQHLFVEPSRHREGIGRALVALAQREQDELQLYTYRANAPARRLYDAAGFVVAAVGTDPATDEPNIRYHWRRKEPA